MPDSPRMVFENQGGMNLVQAPDLLKEGQWAYLQNTRKLLGGRIVARPPLGNNLLPSGVSAGVTSLTRMTDPYMGAPGFVFIEGAAGSLYVNATQVLTGLSGAPVSFLPYRPPSSPQPWCYIGDANKMYKIRSDGTAWKTGIAEPQVAPGVTSPGGGPNPTVYRYTYRSDVTGATSNPSPESFPVFNGADNAAPGAGVSNYNPTQYTNYSSSASGGVMNGQWSSQYGSFNQFETINNGQSTALLLAPIQTQNMTDTGNGSGAYPVPAEATITGIEFQLNWLNASSGAPGTLANCQLAYRGGLIGTQRQPGSVTTSVDPGGTFGAGTIVGGDQDTWGATLSPAIVNDQTFGVNFQILQAATNGTSNKLFIDVVYVVIYWSIPNAVLTPTASTDPQVDVNDWYRMGGALENFTYVGTSPNGATFTDTLSDPAAELNPVLSFANYEPFPSIDLPRKGTCNVVAVSQGVTGVTIASPGSSQTDGTYSVPATGGGGTGAVVQIVIASGTIASATVTAGGTGYTAIPTFPISEGGTPGSLVAAIAPILPFIPNIDWVSGDRFNIRWLPGTIVLIGGIAYVLYNRPSDTTHMLVYTTAVADGTITFGFPPGASGVSFEIAEPTLAAEPSPVIWGPTPDNAGSFYFGLDPLNPGDLVWSMGNNFDSAPDTNRMYVTSPSEPLMNGTITSELSTVFSTERFWLIYPNFSDAVAAVTGTLGQQWALVQAASTRGLYMRYAVAALASLIAWRAKDGIFISQGGGPEKEISGQIYNLFPHGEQEAPQPVVIGSITVYPPDDTRPNSQTITMVPGYIFYDYQDTAGVPRTLVYDMEAKGWSVDVTTPVANCHALPIADNQILLGCVDGTVRAFDTQGAETGTAIIATPAINGGSARTLKRIGGVFLRALAALGITSQFWANRYGRQITGSSPAVVGNAPTEADYLIDFTNATGSDVHDLAAVFSFPLGSGDWLKEWQPDWTEIPEQIVAWRTGMLSYSLQGWLHVPWLRFAYQSITPVTLKLITDQGATATLTIPSSSGQPAKFFTWLPAEVGGISMKFKMLEWVADAGGAPWICYGKDHEVAIKPWGSTGPYQTLRPFLQQSGSTT